MSRKGDCRDNAVAESFLGTLKTERIFGTNMVFFYAQIPDEFLILETGFLIVYRFA